MAFFKKTEARLNDVTDCFSIHRLIKPYRHTVGELQRSIHTHTLSFASLASYRFTLLNVACLRIPIYLLFSELVISKFQRKISTARCTTISKQATAATERNIEQLCGTHTNSLSKFFSIPRQTVWVSKGTIAPLKLPKISHKFRIRSFVCSEWNAIRIHSHIAAKRQIDEFREFDEISAQSDEKVKRYSNEPNR